MDVRSNARNCFFVVSLCIQHNIQSHIREALWTFIQTSAFDGTFIQITAFDVALCYPGPMQWPAVKKQNRASIRDFCIQQNMQSHIREALWTFIQKSAFDVALCCMRPMQGPRLEQQNRAAIRAFCIQPNMQSHSREALWTFIQKCAFDVALCWLRPMQWPAA
jgi:hypothetical protein